MPLNISLPSIESLAPPTYRLSIPEELAVLQMRGDWTSSIVPSGLPTTPTYTLSIAEEIAVLRMRRDNHTERIKRLEDTREAKYAQEREASRDTEEIAESKRKAATARLDSTSCLDWELSDRMLVLPHLFNTSKLTFQIMGLQWAMSRMDLRLVELGVCDEVEGEE